MNSTPDLDRLLDVALAASLEAGRKLLAIYRTDYSVSSKADASPVTDGDLASEQAIFDILQREAPAIPILSEEQAEIPYETRREWHTAWVVDPLDGTKEFLKENGEFTTNIALIVDARPVLGVVYAPAVGTIYWGSESAGAFRATVHAEASDGDAPDRLRSHGQRLPLMAAAAGDSRRTGQSRGETRPAGTGPPAPGHSEEPHRAAESHPRAGNRAAGPYAVAGSRAAAPPAAGRPFTIAASRSHLNEPTRRYISWVSTSRGDPAWITAGSAVKLCLVAEGSADVYPRLGTTMEWDTCAGDAVVRSAGAEVVAYATGAPLEYNKPDLRNPWFVVRRA
jgi:3'(2'), 5'-bisphosphate nucleotidase